MSELVLKAYVMGLVLFTMVDLIYLTIYK